VATLDRPSKDRHFDGQFCPSEFARPSQHPDPGQHGFCTFNLEPGAAQRPLDIARRETHKISTIVAEPNGLRPRPGLSDSRNDVVNQRFPLQRKIDYSGSVLLENTVTATRPFDDIRDLLKKMPKADEAARAAAREREGQLTKPAGSLGRLEEISEWMAAWQGSARPHVDAPLVAVFAGNHGVVAQGVSAFPASVTQAMVANFQAGGAAINQICKTFDLSLKVYELALEKPTGDMTQEPALDEKACAGTIAFGMEALASEPDLLVLGEMGIGNTTSAAAIYHALYGGQAEDWVGRGTGVDDEGLRRKADAVRAAVAFHKPYLDDPLQILARLGGRETAAIAGAILAARLRRTPVLLDGFVVCSAAAVLLALDDSALDHCLAAHVSAERPHRHALKLIGKTPLLDFGMRLGEGSGAALAVGIVKAAVACHNGMATFAEAGVAGKEEP
jgi:nicotinate-nucleotide--dimethylbenzimidazole phosphoribosyltransferase